MNTLIAEIFRTSTLIGIEIHDRKEHTTLEYQPFKKVPFFWRWLCDDQQEGFREWYTSSHVYTAEEIRTGGYFETPLLVEDNKVYYHARITFIFTEGRKFHKYFDTKEAAEKQAWEYQNEFINNNTKLGSTPLSFKLRVNEKK